MHLTTLVELLEQDLGSSASTRSKLSELLAERGDRQGAATQARIASRMEKTERLRASGTR
ncbi:MAG: hypothetical protein AAGA54_33515 [Myxococcota bacterium]